MREYDYAVTLEGTDFKVTSTSGPEDTFADALCCAMRMAAWCIPQGHIAVAKLVEQYLQSEFEDAFSDKEMNRAVDRFISAAIEFREAYNAYAERMRSQAI